MNNRVGENDAATQAVINGLTVGSLFSGIGGLDLALEQLGARVVWQSEIDKHASAILKQHWPDVPNLGDITKVNWDQVELVDVLCGGFPCVDISFAGKGAGIADGTRSGLWFEFANAARILRPRYIIIENVSAIAIRGLDIVLASLAEIGFDAEWTCLRASDVGAPHKRERFFLVACDPDQQSRNEWWESATREAQGGWPWTDARRSGGTSIANTISGRLQRRRGTHDVGSEASKEQAQGLQRQRSGNAAADSDQDGFNSQQPTALIPTPTATDSKASRNKTVVRSAHSRHHDGLTLTDWAALHGATTSQQSTDGNPSEAPHQVLLIAEDV